MLDKLLTELFHAKLTLAPDRVQQAIIRKVLRIAMEENIPIASVQQLFKDKVFNTVRRVN